VVFTEQRAGNPLRLNHDRQKVIPAGLAEVALWLWLRLRSRLNQAMATFRLLRVAFRVLPIMQHLAISLTSFSP
jgi:hypothetical protein